MELITELKAEPIIGKFYLVPCVKINNDVWVPCIGDAHSDIELNIPQKHLHYDVRFVPERMLLSRLPYEPATNQLAKIIGASGSETWFCDDNAHAPLQIELKKRKCLRRMPEFPQQNGIRHKNLHKKYDGAKVKCNRCPHRNFDLSSLPEKDGYKICNGHGLKINCKTNRVESRYKTEV